MPDCNDAPMPAPATTPSTALCAHSRFVQRTRRRHAVWLGLLPEGPPTRARIDALIGVLLNHGMALPSALRTARALVIERLAVLDIEQAAPLEVVTQGMTALAEATLEHALAHGRQVLDSRHGAPQTAEGLPIDFWIVGMGKLGARELNVSSDIDLVYVYEDDGQTTGRPDGGGVITAHEYFGQLARQLYSLIGDTTEDGFVFRMDLALRPNGQSGPPAVSLAMLEEYFLVQGREWERFAWLKSRVVAPRQAIDSGRALQLRDLVLPFVFRRYLDYGVFESLRQLHRKIRDEAQRRAAGRPERANDVKLSRGGIREIEFTVQLLQVVRGGHFPEIRTRSTLRALQRLVAVGVMKAQTAARLHEAYVFLRRVEHRIQYLDDQQTHQLPTDDSDLHWLAHALGTPANGDDPCTHNHTTTTSASACALLAQLCAHREVVAAEFDALLHDGQAPTMPGQARGNVGGGGGGGGTGCRSCGVPLLPVDAPGFADALPAPLDARVRQFAASARVQRLKDESKLRLTKLIGRAAKWSLGRAEGDLAAADWSAATRFVDWLEPLLRRESYVALLVERPEVQSRLLKLLGMARWPMRYLMQHPGVIDELADARLLHERFQAPALLQDLQARRLAWERSGQADEESLLDTLRRAHHAEVFRTLVRDLEGSITVEQVADDLSALADAMLECSLLWSWQHLRQRHRATPQFAVIAYGKLGGKELGYGSDLDIVFLYDDDDDQAPEVYAAFARKLITWLTLRTASGELYEIDTALRPNGNSGLLVTSMAAFERYQTQRGSNTAWIWEHQAITRARWCAGDPRLQSRFEATRRTVLCALRSDDALRREIAEMRTKVRCAHTVADDQFDVKHSPGAMMDVEFTVQYLVLKHSAEHPTLQDNVGNIALLQRAEAAGLLPTGIGEQAATAYRELRRTQHRARLDEAKPTVAMAALGPLAVHRAAVLALWTAVFGTPEAAAPTALKSP